jgi:osmotically-inducible protein OsmY
MADTATVKKIRAALERAADVDLHHNRIEVTGGNYIRLEGEVNNIIVKRRAYQVARQAADGTDVQDNLLVRVERERTGQALLQAVVDTLAGESVFRDFSIRVRRGDPPPEDRNWIEVEVEGSRVRLYGSVWSLSHRRMAEVLAWWVPGTADVDNRIHVLPAENDNDAEITDAIRLIFDKDPSLDGQQIHIRTHDGEVFLEGSVTSDVNRRIADYDCWYIPGVHRVHNNLQVRPTGPRSAGR